MAESEVLENVTDVGEEEVTASEMTHEQKKEEEQAVIQRQIDATEAQMERLEQMETEESPIKGYTMQDLMVGIMRT